MHTILIVEDDLDLCELLKIYLRGEGYNAVICNSGSEAIKYVGDEANEKPDLVLQDVMLPDFDGIETCRRMREFTNVPVIFMSAVDDENYILKALQTGGDDYVTKPINYPQLMARISAKIRRATEYGDEDHAASASAGQAAYMVGDLKIDPVSRTVSYNEKRAHLSPIEFGILLYLVNNAGQAKDTEDIFKHVWSQESIGDVRTVVVHVSNLRNKIAKIYGNGDYIKSIRGSGYMFVLGSEL